jgi:hypothetical protein
MDFGLNIHKYRSFNMTFDSYNNCPISEKSREKRVKRISDRLSQAHQGPGGETNIEEENIIRQLGYAATPITDSKDLNPIFVEPEMAICYTEWFPANLPEEEDLRIPRDSYKIA